MTTAAIHDWRELASRVGDGLEISLLWSKSANRVRVTVSDERFQERYDLDVAGTDALAAFYHPFAHASARSIGLRSAPRSPSQSKEQTWNRL